MGSSVPVGVGVGVGVPVGVGVGVGVFVGASVPVGVGVGVLFSVCLLRVTDQALLPPSLIARIRKSYVTPFSSQVMVYVVSVSLTVTSGLVSGQLSPDLRC